VFLAPSHSDLGESLLITTLLGIPLGEPDGKTPTAGAHRGTSRQRSSEEFDGSSRRQPCAQKRHFPCIGCWIFIADGSGGFENCSIDQDPPEVSEAAKRSEFDKFMDQLEEIRVSNLNDEDRIQPEFDVIKAKTLSELEEDLKKLLEDSTQETSMNGKTTSSNSIHIAEPSFRKKKSRTSFKKTTRKKKQSKNTFSNIDDIDVKIEHCFQKSEDTLKFSTSLVEFSNQWTVNSAELEQEQAFIRYIEELDEPIVKDELAEWSHDIDLFMEGLTNPEKLEALWEQSKVKKLWDDSQNKSPT
jgi:hypothetical protein